MRSVTLDRAIEVTLADGETEAIVNVEFKVYPGSPGYYSGPPEDCYEAEGADWEIRSWDIEDKNPGSLYESTKLIREVSDALVQRIKNRKAGIKYRPNDVLEAIEVQIEKEASECMDDWMAEEGEAYDDYDD